MKMKLKSHLTLLPALLPQWALGHDGHGLDAIPHEIFHFGWLFAIPAVTLLLLRKLVRHLRSRNR